MGSIWAYWTNPGMEKPLLVDQKELHQFHMSIGGDVRTAFELGGHRHLICQKYTVNNECFF